MRDANDSNSESPHKGRPPLPDLAPRTDAEKAAAIEAMVEKRRVAFDAFANSRRS